MSEWRGVLSDAGVVYCQQCGLYIGHMVEVRTDGGRVVTALAVGGAILAQGRGWCQYCKAPWYWHSSPRRLLVRRVAVKEVRPCSTPGM